MFVKKTVLIPNKDYYFECVSCTYQILCLSLQQKIKE